MMVTITFLVGLCVAGLIWTLLRALESGADTYSRVYSEDAARGLADLFFFIPPQRLRDIAASAAGVVFLAAFFVFGEFQTATGVLRGAIIGGLLAAFTLTLPHQFLLFMKARRLQRFNEQLVDALMTMGNALRSGASIPQTFEHVIRQNLNPISQEFSMFIQQTRVGVKFEDALTEMEKRVGSEDLTLMIRSIEIARQTGGNLAEVFEKIAATVRERIRIQGRVQALTSQGRMQGIVVGLLPVALGLVMFGIDPAMMGTFFTSPVGLVLAGVVGVLEVLGGLMIRKIMNIDI